MQTTWPLVPLGRVLKQRKEVPSEGELARGDIHVVSKIGFNDGLIYLRADAETKTDMILVRPGDLVVSGINAAKGAIAIYGATNTLPIAATIHYASYIPDRKLVDVHYLWWLLRSRTFRDILLEYVPGGIKTELRSQRLLPVPVPLPPLAEQQRIVARIDALASRIEDARRLRREAEEETQSLLQRSMEQRIDGGGWPVEELGGLLADNPRNGLGPQAVVQEGGRAMLRINAVSSSPTRFVDESAYKLVDVPEAIASGYTLVHDDVLIVRYNGDMHRVAKAAIYKQASVARPVIYPDKLMRLRPNCTRLDPDYLVYAMSSPMVRSQIEELGKTTAGQIGISGGNAKAFRIAVPPVPEQHCIVAYLDGLQAKVDALKRLQEETRQELAALLPSVLDRAFKGEL